MKIFLFDKKKKRKEEDVCVKKRRADGRRGGREEEKKRRRKEGKWETKKRALKRHERLFFSRRGRARTRPDGACAPRRFNGVSQQQSFTAL